MTRGQMHHLDLTVSDPAASRPFYETFLGHMGYVVGKVHADGYVEFDFSGDSFMSVGLAPSRGEHAKRAPDRYSPGLHHAAWAAASRDDVDAMHAKMTAIGASVLDAPADYPKYNGGRGYYAVFFADPDGLKIEYVWTPRGVEKEA
jgi:glyoxylase I family protein